MELVLPDGIKLNYITGESTPDAFPVIFLHGFTGSSADWSVFFEKLPEGFLPIAVDLIGHGMSSAPEKTELYSTDQIVYQLDELIKSLQLHNIILGGYSMGGRAALSYAIKYPHKLKALILESTTPGIITEHERRIRIESDNKLADLIENNPIESFVDYWMNLPIFASQEVLPLEIRQKIRDSKLKNSQKGLANSLRGFSTGQMPQLWDKLHDLNLKTLLITGSLDIKFTSINAQISEKLKASRHYIIEGAGHNTHLERPEVFLNLLIEFLDKFLEI